MVKTLVYLMIAILALVIATVTIFKAFATNESSYLYGKQQGSTMWNNCTTLADDNGNVPDCNYASQVCQSSSSSSSSSSSNMTACIDGYVQSWNHICDQIKAHKFSISCPTTFQAEDR